MTWGYGGQQPAAFLLGLALGALTHRSPAQPLFYASMFPTTSVIDGKPVAVFCRRLADLEHCDFLRPK